MGLITAAGASLFLAKIFTVLCVGDATNDDDLYGQGVCRVIADAVRDFVEDIQGDNSAGKDVSNMTR